MHRGGCSHYILYVIPDSTPTAVKKQVEIEKALPLGTSVTFSFYSPFLLEFPTGSSIQPLMRPRQRDLLLLGLAVTAGSLDSWSYFGLTHVFIANHTGNTLLLGYSLTSRNWAQALSAGSAIAAYAVGVFAGTLLSRPVRKEVQHSEPDAILWPARTTVALAAELLLLLTAAALASAFSPARGTALAHGLVAIGAVAVGIQSAAMNALNLPGIVTTYISGTWTTLVVGLAQLVDGEERGGEKTAWTNRLLVQTEVIAVYCASAGLSGLLQHAGRNAAMGWLPSVVLAVTVACAWFWQSPSPGRPRSGATPPSST